MNSACEAANLADFHLKSCNEGENTEITTSESSPPMQTFECLQNRQSIGRRVNGTCPED